MYRNTCKFWRHHKADKSNSCAFVIFIAIDLSFYISTIDTRKKIKYILQGKEKMFRTIFSFYFDKITDPLGLPLDMVAEYIILLIIGEVAFQGAYKFIGDLYDEGFINGKFIGSILHWFVRVIIYLIAWATTYGVITAGKWMYANRNIILSIVGICIIICLLIFILAKIFSISKKEA